MMPATRISKNSSRFELTMARYFTRSSSGVWGLRAISRTRRLKASQLSSRLKYAAFAGFRAGTTGALSAAGITALTVVRLRRGVDLLEDRRFAMLARHYEEPAPKPPQTGS